LRRRASPQWRLANSRPRWPPRREIGVLAGIRIERSERGQPGEFDWLDKLDVNELRLLAEGKLDIEAYRQQDGGSSRTGRLN
jgi:hypothetical protein